MEMNLDVGVSTDIGKREQNEDAHYNCFQRQNTGRIPVRRMQTRGYLFAVADGRGGTTGGAEASQLAVDTLDDFYLSDEAIPLDAIIQKANRKSYELNQERHTQMGTTLTVAHLHNGQLYLAHCGDSRAYYFNHQGLFQISRDHNRAEVEFESGSLKRTEIAHLPPELQIRLFAPYRMLGDAPFIEVDTIRRDNWRSDESHPFSDPSIPLSRGDYVILATDGQMERFNKNEGKVVQYLRDTIVLNQEPQAIATALVSIAKCKGTCDNTTVLVIQVRDWQPMEDECLSVGRPHESVQLDSKRIR